MFPSDNNSDNENPLEPLLLMKKSTFCHHQLSDPHQNLITPKQDDDHDPPIFSNFPSPFFDEHELPLNQILPHHNHVMAPGKAADQTEIRKNETAKRGLKSSKLKEKADNIEQPSKRPNIGVVSRKRTGKKDRHSKICTAQGIRDRRMRLSLQIARKFFDLQDMLGYDKASSTIEWLFSKSKKSIREVMTKSKENNNNNSNNYFNFSVSDGKSDSFLSECEVVSGVHEVISSNNEMNKDQLLGNILPNNEKKPRKIARKPNNLRESREKARARARWRTREKMMIKRLENSSQYCPNFSASQNDDVQKLGFSNSPLEGVIIDQEFSGNYTSLISHDVGTIEKLLGNSSLSTTSNICPISDNYDYQCCIYPNSTFMGFLGNWDLLSNVERLNSSQFSVTNQGSSMAGNNSNISVNYSGASSNFPVFRQ